jgi:hypothetical protein
MSESVPENPDMAQVASPLSNAAQPSLESGALAVRDATSTAEHSTGPDTSVKVANTTTTEPSDNTLPAALNVTKWFLDKVVEQERKLLTPVTEKLNTVANELFNRYGSPVVQWCEPKFGWIDKNFSIIVNFLIVSILVISFVQTIVHPFFHAKENNYDPSENQMKLLSVEAVKEFMIKLESRNISEITVQDLLKEALPVHLPIWFYFKYYLMLPLHLLSSMSAMFYLFLTYLISAVCFTYTTLTSHPVVTLITSFGIREMIKENQEKNEREKNHANGTFLEKVNLGWNFLKRIVDPKTKELIGMEFSIRSEAEFGWADILHHDPVLLQKVMDKINDLTDQVVDPLSPPYMVTLDTKEDHIGLSKVLSNLVSCTTLKYAKKARQLKANPREEEDPIFVITCEKDSTLPLQQTRIWLMVPSELKELLKYEKEIHEKRFFRVPADRQNWWIRLEALLLWAKAEFDPVTGERVKSKYISNVINIY